MKARRFNQLNSFNYPRWQKMLKIAQKNDQIDILSCNFHWSGPNKVIALTLMHNFTTGIKLRSYVANSLQHNDMHLTIIKKQKKHGNSRFLGELIITGFQ